MDTLSSDVLSVICDHLYGHSVIALLQTGSHSLAWKLNAGLNSFYYDASDRGRPNFKRWPLEMISRWPILTQLQIEHSTIEMHPETLVLSALDWSKLPNSLTHLTLRVSGAVTEQTMPLIPRGLTKLILDNQEGLPGATMADLPPNLTSFAIWLPTLTEADVALLPRSITELCLWSSAKFKANPTAAALPPNLVRLCVGGLTKSTWDAYVTLLTSQDALSQKQQEACIDGAYRQLGFINISGVL